MAASMRCSGTAAPPEARLTQRDMDLAASVQAVTEEIVLKLGGVRCTRNGRTQPVPRRRCRAKRRRERQAAEAWRFRRMWLQPAAGDAGGAIGAALVAAHMYKREPRAPIASGDGMRGSYLGPVYAQDDIERRLRVAGAGSPRCPTQRSLRMPPARSPRARRWAGTRAGWNSGRAPWRAVDTRRPALADDAETPEPQGEVSRVVPSVRPSVLREDVADWFELDSDSPYMLLVADVANAHRIPMTKEQSSLFGIDKLNVPRSSIPAVPTLTIRHASRRCTRRRIRAITISSAVSRR
jgi:carbamoyltransferase